MAPQVRAGASRTRSLAEGFKRDGDLTRRV